MKETIKNKCDLLTENREKLAKQFNHGIYPFVS